MRRFSMCFLVIGILSLLVADVSRAGQRHKAKAEGGSRNQNSKPDSCQTKSPVIDKGTVDSCQTKSPVIDKGTDVDPGQVDSGSVDSGTSAGSGSGEIVLDDDGKMDGDIVVDDTEAQPGLRAGAARQGRVTVMNGSKERTTSQLRIRGSDGQTKLVPGIRLRSASGKPLALQQVRVKTATGQTKTVVGIRVRTSSGKTTVLPVTQLRTSDGKTVTFVSPPKGNSLLVTRRATGDRESTSPDKSPK